MSFIEQTRKEKKYKRFIGLEKNYDKIGQRIFKLLLSRGLKKDQSILDVGCGSLRIGKYLINYLDPKCYYGIDPESWLILEASRYEIGNMVIEKKRPQFYYSNEFNLSCFDESFDFILANSVFIHASKKQIERCLDEVEGVLKKSGKFIFNFIEGLDNLQKEWVYPGYVTYTKKYIEYELLKKGFIYEYIKCDYPGKQIFIEVTNV